MTDLLIRKIQLMLKALNHCKKQFYHQKVFCAPDKQPQTCQTKTGRKETGSEFGKAEYFEPQCRQPVKNTGLSNQYCP